MPKVCYKDRKLKPQSLALIRLANEIIEDYQNQGYNLTLRQLYYQFVARDYLPNTLQSYNKLGLVINRGRLAGYIDWLAIEDRTRSVSTLPHWESPADVIESAAYQFRMELWKDQPNYVEVWVEKEALAGVIKQACVPLDVSFFSCRGYVSASEMYSAGQRFINTCYKNSNRMINDEDLWKSGYILHIGDHDPSGIDMTRDIRERMQMFTEYELLPNIIVERIGLNMDQIEDLNPPPNPAKITDTRAREYIKTYGESSWELDALSPKYLTDLITKKVNGLMDKDLFDKNKKVQEEKKRSLNILSENWDDVEIELLKKEEE